jgi:hypothetical protein
VVLLRIIVPYQWRAFWGGLFSRGAWGGTNLSLVVLLSLWLLPGHVTSSILAAVRMHADPSGAGSLLAEVNLTSLLIAWLLTPLVITGLQAHGEGVTPWRLTQFPLRTRQLMLVGISSSLIHPGYWLLALASLAGLAPIVVAPFALPGLLAGALFFTAAAMLSWALGLFGSVLFASRRAREVVLLVITLLATSIVLLADLKFEHRELGFYATAWGREWLLSDTSGTRGILPAARDNTPGAWVVKVALGREVLLSFVLLVTWFAGSWLLAIWCLRRMLGQPVAGLGGGRKTVDSLRAIPFLPPLVGLVASKELRYLMRTMDAILGIALGLGGAVYLVIAGDPSRLMLLLGVPLVLVMEMAMPMNCFGLDRLGVDRYRLFPVAGRDLVLAKNLAFHLVVMSQVMPLVVAGGIRFGAATALATLFGTVSFAILLSLWGNAVSIRAPTPRAFYNFDSIEQAGGMASILYSVAVWLLPAGIAVASAPRGPGGILLGQVAFFAACALLYARLLARSGAAFERNAELMRRRLAG